MDVLIRDLPAEVHAELVRRAEQKDISLRAYLRQVLAEHVAVPSMEEWLQSLRELGPVDSDGAGGAELVAEGRTEDDDLVSR